MLVAGSIPALEVSRFFKIFLKSKNCIKIMGRKTNSNSLRIKKTNKDYLSCWYGDLLYSQIFEKSLTLQNCITAILKTNGVSVPQISSFSGFKKYSFLLCYLDPNSRKSFSESLNFKNKNDWPSPIEFRGNGLNPVLKKVINFENIILTKPYKKSYFLSFSEENRLAALPELLPKERAFCYNLDLNYKNKDFLSKEKNQNIPKIFKEFRKKAFDYKSPEGSSYWQTKEREKQNLRFYFYKILFFPFLCGFRNNLILYRNRKFSFKKKEIEDFYKSSINKKRNYILKYNLFSSFLNEMVSKNVEKNKNQFYLPNFYKNLSKFWENVYYVYFIRTLNEKANSLFLAHYISYFLERKVSFRRIKRQIFQNISLSSTKKKTNFFSFFGIERDSNIRGIRISCKGRVGGRSKKAQRSRKETFMWGETGLHVFSSKLDFAKTSAETSFGLVGVQVWICIK